MPRRVPAPGAAPLGQHARGVVSLFLTHLEREGRKTVTIRRRELLAALGGAVVWPLAARAQQADRMRRIGVLLTFAESDPEVKAWLTAFEEALQLCLSVLSLVASLRHGS